MKEVSQSDLKAFVGLKHLDLDYNDITVLKKDLFKFNTELEVIRLRYNKISRIHAGVFDNLSKLQVLTLSTNVCVSRNVANRPDVVAFIASIKQSCPSTTSLDGVDEEVVNSLSGSVESLRTAITQNRRRCDESMRSLQSALSQLDDEKTAKIVALEAKVSTLIANNNQQPASGLQTFLTFVTEKEPLLIFIALPTVLLLTVLNIAVIVACAKRGGQRKVMKPEEPAFDGVALREMPSE
jgi:Leucine-rich repeat (LRR) protein